MAVYNNNRDHNHNIYDEIKEQKSKMKGQPFKVKFSYFVDYYLKASIIGAIALALVISLIVSIVNQPDDTVFSSYFVNTQLSLQETPLVEDFAASINIDTKKHNVYVDTSITYSEDGSDYYDTVTIQKLVAVMASGELDTMVGNENVINHFAEGDCFLDITTILPADLMEQFQDDLYYAKNEEGETIPVGIYLNDAPQLTKYGYFTEFTPILGVITNSKNTENTIAFIRFLYTE